ncbi:caspase domain-containing protein [Mycena vitilis]|nr:caspase domain-containing protein [Mycena vitilis]
MHATHRRSNAARTTLRSDKVGSNPNPVPSKSLAVVGQKKALLIGIRGFKMASDEYPVLKGSHNDVFSVQKLLIECYGYEFANITILIDDGVRRNPQPTRANILKAIRALVKDAKAGDHFCFHYCGHSTQVENRSNTEEDGLDECIIPCDGEEKKIVDNELKAALVNPLPAGSHLVAVLDTCHSGSLLGTAVDSLLAFRGIYTDSADLEYSECSVARKNARLLSSSTRLLAKQNEINMSVVCRPTLATTEAGTVNRSSTRTVTYRARTVTFDEKDKETDASVPSPADAANAGADFAPRGRCWLLSEEGQPERRCESPDGMFESNGWCGNAERPANVVQADVISLASCKDSEMTYEDGDGKSMTASLVEILRRHPSQSLKDVLVSISRAMYTKTLIRHAKFKAYNTERKELVDKANKCITQLRRTASLITPDEPLAPAPIAASPTFPAPRKRSFIARRMDDVKRLKQLVIDCSKPGYDTNTMQHPELTSARPLDMGRQWRM